MSNLELVKPFFDSNASALTAFNLTLDHAAYLFGRAKDLDTVKVIIDETPNLPLTLRKFTQQYDYAKFLSSLTNKEWFTEKSAQVEFEIIERGYLDVPYNYSQDNDKLEDYVAKLDISDCQYAMPDAAELGSTYLHRHETVQIRLCHSVISKLHDALIEEKVS